MVADDPLGLAEPADLGGDVHLEVDVIDPQGDGLAQELLPLLFVAPPETAVDATPDREDHRRGTVLENPLEVGIPAQAVDSQLHQVDARLGGLIPLLGQRGMPSAPDRYTDHRHLALATVYRPARTASTGLDWTTTAFVIAQES